MKVAIVHDELMRRGGAEQVVLTLLKAFPDADLFTLAYNKNGTYPEFEKFNVKTSRFQAFAKNVKIMHALFLPFGIWAMKGLKLKGYDIVVISNTHCGKYVDIDPFSKVFLYTHTPFRLAWNPESYSQFNTKNVFKKWVMKKVVSYLRKVDTAGAKKGDYFIGNSRETSEKIKQAYKVNDVAIIHPDVKCRYFYTSEKPKNYYLLVSRLEYYKKVDLAIEAFNQLGTKLIIVGEGTKSLELRSMANSNIEFKGVTSNEELAELYANCKALIFPQYEDYGITPLEANASGRPVIAYSVGGINDTMIPYDGDSMKSTAVFFDNQTSDSLQAAVKKFETLKFDPVFIRQHAEKFDESVFIDKIKKFVAERAGEKVSSRPTEELAQSTVIPSKVS